MKNKILLAAFLAQGQLYGGDVLEAGFFEERKALKTVRFNLEDQRDLSCSFERNPYEFSFLKNRNPFEAPYYMMNYDEISIDKPLEESKQAYTIENFFNDIFIQDSVEQKRIIDFLTVTYKKYIDQLTLIDMLLIIKNHEFKGNKAAIDWLKNAGLCKEQEAVLNLKHLFIWHVTEKFKKENQVLKESCLLLCEDAKKDAELNTLLNFTEITLIMCSLRQKALLSHMHGSKPV